VLDRLVNQDKQVHQAPKETRVTLADLGQLVPLEALALLDLLVKQVPLDNKDSKV